MSNKQTRQELLEKERKSLLSKDFVKNNPIFTVDHIVEFHELFSLYADPRTRRADVRDILLTAKTLGLDTRYTIVYRALTDLVTEYNETEVDFDTFIKDLTDRLGSPFTEESRRKVWELLDYEVKDYLNADDIAAISKELRFNLSDADIKEIIQNVGGYEADSISYEKFEKYMARKVHRRHLEQDLLKS